MNDYDVIFAGGGLASTLAAYRLATTRPHKRILIVEGGPSLGGNHTWSFHRTDLTPDQNRWISPFISYSWDGQIVRFPRYTRRLRTVYQSITSDRLHSVASSRLEGGLMLNARIEQISPGSVTLADGQIITATCVIDGRGAAPSKHLDLGFQKFVGLELKLSEPHGETVPVIMDADLSQDDGYRFIYTLPFSPDTILIEDTYYADGPALEQDAICAKILDYAARRGWKVREVLRTETGTLPILLGGNIDGFWREAGRETARIGLRACLFHPTTGYSLPDAVATADALSSLPELTSARAAALTEALSRKHWRERGFYRMLNRFLFLAAKPDRRFEVMQRFYTMRETLIERFYAAALTAADKARILVGRPPVPIMSALATIREDRSRITRMGGPG